MQLESYLQTSASERMLTDPHDFQNTIRDLKVGKTPGPNGIPNRALSIFLSGRYSSLFIFSIKSYASTTFLQFGSTPD